MHVLHFFPYPLKVSVDPSFVIGYGNLADWRVNLEPKLDLPDDYDRDTILNCSRRARW